MTDSKVHYDFGALSLNVRGLNDFTKRRKIFEFLNERNEQIMFLQESHSVKEVEHLWNSEFKGEILFSHGSRNSRGTVIMFKKSLEYSIIEKIQDLNGRYLIVKALIQGNLFVLGNCYAPVSENDQIPFYQEFNKIVAEFCLDEDTTLILGGDFNNVLDPNLDKKGGVKNVKEKSLSILNEMKEEFDLLDIWRVRNPTLSRFTWRQRKPLVQCRLDYWLVSDSLQDNVKTTSIIPAIATDHSMITIHFTNIDYESRGPSHWKLNTSLLEDKQYKEEICNQYPLWLQQFSENSNDYRKQWDGVKYKIRQFSMEFSKKKARQNRNELILLENRVKILDTEISENPDDQKMLELQIAKSKLEEYHNQKVKGSIIRSRAKWYEEGEKNTRYFLNLEKRHKSKSTIRKLIIDEESEMESINQKHILKNIEGFYESLYSSKIDTHDDDTLNYFIKNPNIPKLTEDLKHSCEGLISFEEGKEILDTFETNKTPGNDGIPIEFYKTFWFLVGSLVINSLNEGYHFGEMSTSQKQGVITLIEKKDSDKRKLKNWRPISLINVDTKIGTKIIAKRLEKVLPKIINHDQTGYVKGRYIGETLRVIDDIIYHTNLNNIPGILITIDFEKAFDSLEWSFMISALEAFNFGKSLIKWVKTFYNNITSCVMNNGFSTKYFDLRRGVRQGDPLSPFLFIVALELLTINIRNKTDIKGIKIGNEEVKLAAYADDLSIFSADISSAENLFKVLDKFYICSGLKINKEKCEAMWIGSNRERQDFPLDIRWNKDMIKILGIFFSHNSTKMIQKNFDQNIIAIKEVLNIWSMRNLSLIGKICILKSLAISKLIYVSSVLFTPQNVIKQVNSIIFNFLWNGKDKVKRKVIISDYEHGGLKMVDFESRVKSLNIIWIKRLLDKENKHVWKVIPKLYFENFGGIEVFLRCNYSLEKLNLNLPLFYRNILQVWKEIFPTQQQPIEEQILWNNQNILVAFKSVFFRELWFNGIVFVHDIFDNSGLIFTWQHIKRSFGLSSHLWIKYYGLISAIPHNYKEYMKKSRSNYSRPNYQDLILKLKSTEIEIKDITSKKVYLHLVEEKQLVPTAQAYFENRYNLSDIPWTKIYSIPFLCTIDSRLRSFQYKILNNILYLNDFLYNKLKVVDNPRCSFCKTENETSPHLFFSCSFTLSFLRDFATTTNLISLRDLEEKDIILGKSSQLHQTVIQKNFVILLIKWYLYRCRMNNTLPSTLEFKTQLGKYKEIEFLIAKKKGKLKRHYLKWKNISV